jgi:hypothetical protein
VRVFSFLLSIAGEFLIDVEEPLDDSPVSLLPIPEVRGVGTFARLRGPVDGMELVQWLQAQQWLALACPLSELERLGRVRWSVDRFFANPLELAQLVRETKATLALVSYYDGDSWLLAIDTEDGKDA